MNVLALDPTNASSMLQSFGLVGVFVILFAETGLLVGFFLPGDGLLFLTGIVAAGASHQIAGVDLPLPALLIGAPLSAIAGSQVGYLLGRSAGRRMGRGRHGDRLDRGERYLARYGTGKALMLARFAGVIRTAINPAAGMLRVPPWQFLLWNVAGALLWTDGVILAGYLFGASVPFDIDTLLTPLTIAIMVVATVPAFVAYLRRPRVSLPTTEQDDRATHLHQALDGDITEPHTLLTTTEAAATGHLLDQVTAAYPEGPTRTLAGTLSSRLHDRIGVTR
jgi:membrane-associated protein